MIALGAGCESLTSMSVSFFTRLCESLNLVLSCEMVYKCTPDPSHHGG
ncbi:hypothetical protein BFJ70_g1107 [Fusarium oxysporum]|uniref:Uncharacterized protein n=2 Tax=Fusarium oxysporum TaxID=5507 RepID=A0A420QPC6_FUSOX|nr:hypothetical protein BFJ65_g6366 [Fusarium oxysporum f. sp. cepae]RKL06576.1 hypothetical protein BFJ71_g2517 [Fusarium oxysporum]RKK50192.1 hypothetical protein BFJ67_g6594 [Fusarium oxysporum f. sp. cepae]RKK50527.1 hypothetical protein BFJ66_g6582 [Fusarium oxysporum f. sp. cepae]RKL23220.1 hypothetical protein BFJ68_g1426 [Fusarium oxysporum]